MSFFFIYFLYFRLDWLEKHEPSPIPEGYTFSLVYACLIDCTQSVYAAIEIENMNLLDSSINSNKQNDINKETLAKDLFYASYLFLLEGHSLLLECRYIYFTLLFYFKH